MKTAKGRRPWPIWLFAGIASFLAVRNLIIGLNGLKRSQFEFERMATWFEWDRDWTIVALSAWFTIEMIPILLVVLFASRFARWFISATALVPLAIVLSDLEFASTYPRFISLSVLNAAIPIALAALLFTREANIWFSKERPLRPATFD